MSLGPTSRTPKAAHHDRVALESRRGPEYGPATQSQKVIDLSPETVYLMYNCYYMNSICANAKHFMDTTRGKRLHEDDDLDLETAAKTFGFDLNTGKKSRKTDRRDQSCPETWKDGHACPENGQVEPWRNDRQWWTEKTESGSNVLMHLRAGQNVVPGGYSKIMYTCDEFPAASFVEGGDGLDGKTPSQTRCAAVRCAAGVKAEQDWQGTAHQNLWNELLSIARRRRTEFPQFDNKNSIIFFKFVMYKTENDGIAARVISYSDKAFSVVTRMTFINQAKRNVNSSNPDPYAEGNALYEKLQAIREAGYKHNHIRIHANHSSIGAMSMESLTPQSTSQMSSMALARRWGLQDQRAHPKPPPVVPKNQVPVVPVAPLLRRASSASLDRARAIVEQAISESTKRNEARYANPRRKNYQLKPGTIVGQSVTGPQRRDVGDGVVGSELLEITDEIAQAAALVAEAEAVTSAGFQNDTLPGNFTGIHIDKRQAAGAFWMATIARKGKVP